MAHGHSFASVDINESKRKMNAYNRLANTLVVGTLLLDKARNLSKSYHILHKHCSLSASNFSRAGIPSYQPQF